MNTNLSGARCRYGRCEDAKKISAPAQNQTQVHNPATILPELSQFPLQYYEVMSNTGALYAPIIPVKPNSTTNDIKIDNFNGISSNYFIQIATSTQHRAHTAAISKELKSVTN